MAASLGGKTIIPALSPIRDPVGGLNYGEGSSSGVKKIQGRDNESAISEEDEGDKHLQVEDNIYGAIQKETLDCPICWEVLTSPVHQCHNGHVICSSCHTRLTRKYCPVCRSPIGSSRCGAMEKVLESFKLNCQNAKYGCKVRVGMKCDHKMKCEHIPCSCPLSDCNFVGSSSQLCEHFSSKHKSSAISFQYFKDWFDDDSYATFSININDKFLVLQNEVNDVLFVLNNMPYQHTGNAILLSCIAPSWKKGNGYVIWAGSESRQRLFISYTKCAEKRVDNIPSMGFFLVPSDFFDSSGQLCLSIAISGSTTVPRFSPMREPVLSVGGLKTGEGSSSRNQERSGRDHQPCGEEIFVQDEDCIYGTISKETLKCPICCDILTSPVIQCYNGHACCSTCCHKTAHKCPTCQHWPIGNNRSRTTEKVLESLKVKCQNTKYGCKERRVSFTKKYDHEMKCEYRPCSCPLPDCEFVGSSIRLYKHFRTKHKNLALPFSYLKGWSQDGDDSYATFMLNINDKILVLQNEVNDVIFVLNNMPYERIGNAILLSCIAPSWKKGNRYLIWAGPERSQRSYIGYSKCIEIQDDNIPSMGFFLVPLDFFDSNDQLCLNIAIYGPDGN